MVMLRYGEITINQLLAVQPVEGRASRARGVVGGAGAARVSCRDSVSIWTNDTAYLKERTYYPAHASPSLIWWFKYIRTKRGTPGGGLVQVIFEAEISAHLAGLLDVPSATNDVVFVWHHVLDDWMSAKMNNAGLVVPIVLKETHGIRCPPPLPGHP